MLRGLHVAQPREEVYAPHLSQLQGVVVNVPLDLLHSLSIVAQVPVPGLSPLTLGHDGLQLLFARPRALHWALLGLLLQTELCELPLLEALLHANLVRTLIVRHGLEDVIVRGYVPVLASVAQQLHDGGAVVDAKGQRVLEVRVHHPHCVQLELFCHIGRRLRVEDIAEVLADSVLLICLPDVHLPLEARVLIVLLRPVVILFPSEALLLLDLVCQGCVELRDFSLQAPQVVVPLPLFLLHLADLLLELLHLVLPIALPFLCKGIALCTQCQCTLHVGGWTDGANTL
mmetsp:Transcript_20536/g.56722  ORF Transcript_20536/g.56722 Transcript_20536/m.56722 type:complete len:287 (+) Transcript_20536:1077-1937(+)